MIGKSKATSWACGLLLALVLVLSLKTLTTFPDPFDDEGIYASNGYGLVTTGVYNSDAATRLPPYQYGDGVHSRLAASIFGLAAAATGSTSLATARLVSFTLVGLATVVWFFIGPYFGVPGVFAALLLASAERVFYSSHVFRPEATTIFLSSLLILAWLRWNEDPLRPRRVAARGLFNGLFVIGHVNGIVGALLNSFELMLRRFKAPRQLVTTAGLYFVTSCLAILAVYLAQIRPGGGFDLVAQQVAGWGVWKVRTPLESLVLDLQHRWGTELIAVGGSQAAKVLRAVFYATIFVTALHSILALGGRARKFGALAIGTVLGYMFFVQDKIDIHIAEMVPWFLASLLAWAQALAPRWRHARLAPVAVVAIGLALCTHHALKYRQPTPWSATHSIAELPRLLKESGVRPDEPLTVIAGMEYWFDINSRSRFIYWRYGEEHLPIHGRVVLFRFINKPAYLAGCTVTRTEPSLATSILTCP